MKKIFVLFALVLCLLLTASCVEQIPDEKVGDVKPPVTEDETVTAEPVTPPEKIEYNYSVSARDYASIDALTLEQRANEFISALCLQDTEVLEMYIGGKIDKLDSVKMDAYVKSIEGEIAKVGVTVYESNSAGLPVGEHEYILDLTQNGICYVSFFGTAEKHNEYFNGTKTSISEDALTEDGYFFCYLSIRIGAITDIDVYHNAKHTGMLGSSLTDLETITKYLYDRFGIEDINDYPEIKDRIYQDRQIENGKEMFFVNCAHGADSSPWIFDNYSIDGNKYSFTFTFYSDFAYISPALKATYNFEKRDGCDILTFTGITSEKLGDESVATFSF